MNEHMSLMSRKISKRTCLKLGGLAFLIGVLTLLPAVLASHGLFLWIGDRFMQIYYIQRHIHDVIWSGGAFWDALTDLGMDMYGTNLFYGLLSPFTLLGVLIPPAVFPYAMLPLEGLKFAVGAVGAYLYICRYTEKDSSAFIGGMLYAFAGFHIDNLQFHFGDATVLFPLLLMSFDMLVRDRRRGPFGVMLLIAVMTNYYFAFGECICLMIYYIVLAVSGEIRFRWKSLAGILTEGILGLGMGCFVLLPAAFTILNTSKVGKTIFDTDLLSYAIPGTIMYIIRGMFLMPDFHGYLIYDELRMPWSSCYLYIPLIGMTGVIWAFRQDRKKWWSRLLIVCAVIAAVPILNSVFSLFNYNYYGRWFFFPVLVMCLMCAKLCDSFETADISHEVRMTVTAGVIFTVHVIVRQAILGRLGNWNTLGLYAVSFANACLTPLLLLWLSRADKTKLRLKDPLPVLACAFCAVLPLMSAVTHMNLSYAEHFEIVWDMATNGGQGIDLGDGEEYSRTLCRASGYDNAPVVYGYPSIFYYHSNIPTSSTGFYSLAGVPERGSIMAVEDNDRAELDLHELESFLSVKYYLIYNEKLPGGIKVEVRDRGYQVNGFTLDREDNSYVYFTNDNFIPMGFTYDYYLPVRELGGEASSGTEGFVTVEDGGAQSAEELTSNDRQRLLLKAIWLTDEQIERYEPILDRLPDELREDRTEEAYVRDCADRAAHSAYSFEPDGRGFTSRIDLERDDLVFYSVAYDEGFTCYVDGRETPIEKVFGGLSAVYVPAGDHEIRFEYFPKGLKAGIAVSLVSLGAFVGYLIIARRREGPAREE